VRTKLLSVAVVLGLMLAANPARASDDVRRRGWCSGGSGRWELRVWRETRNSLRVRFSVEHVPPGHTWQLFLSDDGVGVLARSKVSTGSGEVRVGKAIRNRLGTDRIEASGVNLRTGELCAGSLRY
jgi:hypothetical protein